MARQSEIEQLLLTPIYLRANALTNELGYEPPIFRPGKSAVQSVKKTQITIAVDFDIHNREPATLSGTMWETNADFVVTVAVPDKIPNINGHKIVKDFLDSLQMQYSLDFCRDVEQVYLDDISWGSSVDTTSRTDYTLTISLRFMDYPQTEVA